MVSKGLSLLYGDILVEIGKKPCCSMSEEEVKRVFNSSSNVVEVTLHETSCIRRKDLLEVVEDPDGDANDYVFIA